MAEPAEVTEPDCMVRGKVKVAWSRLGEGLSGDYDPKDPTDRELLRFDVYKWVNGEWAPMEDASYCTQVPVTATDEIRKKLLDYIMWRVRWLVEGNTSIKRLCEQLSWIREEDARV